MKILFVTHVTGMAGANRSMFQLIKELKENYGCNIVVAGPFCADDTLIKEKFREIGVDYLDAPVQFFKKPLPHRWSAFVNHIRYLRGVRNYYKKLLPFKFDIVHSNSSVIDCGAWLSKQLQCYHVWHLREFGDYDYKLYPIGGVIYERIVYKQADAFIAISKSVKNHFSTKLDGKKIQLIYNGIPPVDKNLWSQHRNKKIEFICAGIICETKNQKEIVVAVNELVNKKHETDFHVTIVGIQNKKYTDLLLQYINNFHLENFITILPEVDGIQQLVSKMDVGIVPSHAEAFGRVTVEYMLQNLLVIANNQGANTELITDGLTGMIYSIGDSIALADKMQKVIHNRQLLISLSKAGCDNANARFLSYTNTKSIFELYKKLVDKQK